MATLNEIVYSLKNMSSGGKTPVDFPFSDAQIAHFVDNNASSLRIDDINAKGFIDNSNIQDLGCQLLTKVDSADCTLVNFGVDVKYLDIPATLQLKKNNAIEFFGMVDKTTIIPFYDVDIVPYNRYIRFPKKLGISASLIGSRIYVRGANALNLCYVNVRGAFQLPSQVESCTSEGATHTCYDWNCQYPIGQHLLETHYINGQAIEGLYSRVLKELGFGMQNSEMQLTKTEIKPV
jgi:hypothetical protein